jgi:hypothetical protein
MTTGRPGSWSDKRLAHWAHLDSCHQLCNRCRLLLSVPALCARAALASAAGAASDACNGADEERQPAGCPAECRDAAQAGLGGRVSSCMVHAQLCRAVGSSGVGCLAHPNMSSAPGQAGCCSFLRCCGISACFLFLCWRRGRQVALDVAEALDYLHTELNIMHSDLKSRWVGHCPTACLPPATCAAASACASAAHSLLPLLSCPPVSCACLAWRQTLDCGSGGRPLLRFMTAHPLRACLPVLPSACSNVLLSEEGRAFVADLGLAQALDVSVRTAAVGTRMYAGTGISCQCPCKR